MEQLLKGKRIFIVEDNLPNRIIYQTLLMQYGARVEFERWGRDTLSRLKNFPNADLIVLDLMLTDGLTGYDIIAKLRALPQYASVPIVAVSASDPSDAITRTQATGFNGFIAKPIDDQLFPRQLLQVMNGQPVWHAG